MSGGNGEEQKKDKKEWYIGIDLAPVALTVMEGNACYVLIRNERVLLLCEAALRIIGGRDALKDEFPYAVRLELMSVGESRDNEKNIYYQLCTGAVITPDWIVTAAHCYIEEYFNNTHVKMVARYNSFFPNHMGQISPILDAFIHPRYEQVDHTREYDIGLFRSKNILVSQYGKISAVEYNALVGHEVNILGFGGTNASEIEKPLQVLKGMLSYCLEGEFAPATAMCVVPLCNVAATICGGDSGGPVIHSSGIVGVNSRSEDDCNEFTTSLERTPGTSASVVAMLSSGTDWILNIVSNKIVH